MRAIILSAGGPSGDSGNPNQHPISMLHGPSGRRVMDWILSSFNRAGVNDIAIVAGYHIEEIGENYPGIRIYYNTEWETNNVLDSLFYAEPEMKNGFITSYADVVFRPNIIKKLLKDDFSDIALAVDPGWRNHHHYISNPNYIEKAEKVIVENGNITRIGKNFNDDENIFGQFIGLAKFSSKAARIFRDRYNEIKSNSAQNQFHEAANLSGAFLTDMLQEMIDLGLKVSVVTVEGDWEEIESSLDLARFVFGTKGETLERLQPVISNGIICDQVRFTVEDWDNSKIELLKSIQAEFNNQTVVVRSSALSEDAWNSSMAGSFTSILGVNSANLEELENAVRTVIRSYAEKDSSQYSNKDQVLIQLQIQDVVMSGVMFTVDLETGAPYYTINYDDVSSRTDSITAGNTSDIKTILIYKNDPNPQIPSQFRNLLMTARELEEVIGYNSLDIEFAVSKNGNLYILQTRPIAVNIPYFDDAEEVVALVKQVRSFISNKLRAYSHIPGNTTMFGDMPDWNPAEMIGTHPKPLAFSLYEHLITDRAWREARAKLGYHSVFPEKLMISLAGHPFIDIRNSFNNLTPAALPEELADRLLNHYLERLKNNIHLHDKVEFDIVLTCMTFDFDQHADRIRDDKFSENDIDTLRLALLKITDDVIANRIEPIKLQLKLVSELTTRREKLLGSINNAEDISYVIKTLLEDCIELGTIPFSILARYAFIGNSILRSIKEKRVINQTEYNEFLECIQTVAGELVEDVGKLSYGRQSKVDFLSKYGHLRPGTYDIMSYSYAERPDLYLPDQTDNISDNSTKLNVNNYRAFEFNDQQKSAVSQLLYESGFTCTLDDLLTFIPEAISGREFAKFEFTKNISCILDLLCRFGDNYKISREDMSFLTIQDIIRMTTEIHYGDPRSQMIEIIKERKNRYRINRMVHLPTLITSVKDVSVIKMGNSRPNFVTSKQVSAHTVFLNRENINADIENKIVLIEGADPGYDWIFMKNIRGLITMYGGAASHMTIRCAEFGLPAAIGCGEALFNRLKNAHSIELNCDSGYVRVN